MKNMDTDDMKKRNKKVIFMPMPIIMSNPTFGPSFGAMGSLMYKLNENDKISPMSKTGFMGMYGINKSYSWWVSQEMYLKQDNYRIIMNVGSFEIPVDYMYQQNQMLEYNEANIFFRIKLLKKIATNFYAGVYYNYTTQNFANINNLSNDPDIKISDNIQSSIGFMGIIDTRDYVYYPTTGFFSNLYLLTNQKFIGASANFYNLNYNLMHYIPVFNNDVLAMRLNGVNSFGEVPYGALALYGVSSVDLSQVDLRGYMRGRYRGKNQIDFQIEYRYNFNGKLDRFGLVLNGGIGRIWDSDYQSTLYNSNIWLPAIGTGIRYNAIKRKHVNIRLDYGYGIKSNHAIYLGLYEAF